MLDDSFGIEQDEPGVQLTPLSVIAAVDIFPLETVIVLPSGMTSPCAEVVATGIVQLLPRVHVTPSTVAVELASAEFGIAEAVTASVGVEDELVIDGVSQLGHVPTVNDVTVPLVDEVPHAEPVLVIQPELST